MTIEMRNAFAEDLNSALLKTGVDAGIAAAVSAEYTELVDELADCAATLIVARKVVKATADYSVRGAELRRTVTAADSALDAFRQASARVQAAAENLDAP